MVTTGASAAVPTAFAVRAAPTASIQTSPEAGGPHMATDRRARAKQLGEQVEAVVIDAIDGLEPAADRDDWYDAVVEVVVGPRTAPAVRFYGICLLEPGVCVEIKATQRRLSNGARPNGRPGLWSFREDQHQQLLDASAAYCLVLYDDDQDEPVLEMIAIVPASIVDTLLGDYWHDVAGRDHQRAQLAWPHVLGGDAGAE